MKNKYFLASLFWAALGGCTEERLLVDIGTAALGDTCSSVSDCVAGLDCVDQVCAPLEEQAPELRGMPCVLQADCGTELFCGRQGVCTSAQPKTQGTPCGLTVECEDPLICSADGQCTSPNSPLDPGTFDLGQSCTNIDDCRRPYVCALSNVCSKIRFFSGPDCERSDDEAGAYRYYFEVPNPSAAPREFYRLPFPNDVRVAQGRIQLGGHPSPGEVLGLSVTDAYITAIEEDVDAYATNAPVFLRGTDPFDPTTLCLTPGSTYPDNVQANFCELGGDPTVYLVNLDTSAFAPIAIRYSTPRGQYICQNWIGLAPLPGVPLEQGATYAAVITTDLLDSQGFAPIQDREFTWMLSSQAPGDPDRPELDAAHAAYAPLRDWIGQNGIAPETIANAAVFTTSQTDTVATQLMQAVENLPTPSFDATEIACPEPSPPAAIQTCHNATIDPTRDCPATPAATFHEVHATFSGPIFQDGTRPYTTAGDGGAFDLNASGIPVLQGTESMCMSVAIPNAGSMPPNGWPTVVVAHGTGGNYRTAILDQTAARLTDLGFAVVSFDNVLHGPRQGTAPAIWQLDPGSLFFNIPNPRASRDNVLQGAADLQYIARLLAADSLTTTTTGAISFDPAKLYFFGHSQGTVIAPPMLAASNRYGASVLSAIGAELSISILNKTQPFDLSLLAATYFADKNMDRIHPMMGLLTHFFARSDALAFTHRWLLEPFGGKVLQPILQIAGLGDGFTPQPTHEALMRAAGLPLVGLVSEPVDGVAQVASPASNNVNGTTAGALQFMNFGSSPDPHFVAFYHPDAIAAVENFFQTQAAGAATISRGSTP